MRFAFLGTSAALPSATRDTTSMLVDGSGALVLVDVGGSPVQKLRRLGIDPLAVTHVIVTHLHADHAYGLPALVQNLRSLGRRAPLPILCRPEHVDGVRTLLQVFNLWRRSGMFELNALPVDATRETVAFEHGGLTVTTAPNEHGSMPNFAVRFAERRPGIALVYSSDTRPADAVLSLARGADTLVHDATFVEGDRERVGSHSSAREAGDIAARAGVRRLILTHIDAAYHDRLDGLVEEARRRFHGVVEVARELSVYEM
jgi:ribonuclease Z